MSTPLSNDIMFALSLLPSNVDGLKILDLGAGEGFWGWKIRIKLEGIPLLVGVDIDGERVKKVKKLNIYDYFFENDARIYVKTIEDNYFDITIFSHVIEHLSKDDGYEILDQLKRITKKLLLIPYPDGDWLSKGYDEKSRAYHNLHNSIWREKDFRKLGFNTRVFRFSAKAGRVVSYFERFYLGIRGVTKSLSGVAWLENTI